ncbi:MAG: nitroreductase family protein [Gudongella sp.]|jgi:nitroreductase|nr:nitroreductase family protein [Gudongella sp.]
MIRDLVLKNRTYRRFYQDVAISEAELLDWIDLARLTSTGANLQQLRYVLSFTPEKNEEIFKELKWAAYLKDWDGPEEGEKPSAYIIMLSDNTISTNIYWNHGLACQSILLGAVEKGYGACMFGSFNKNNLREKLRISDQYEILMVIALGKPKEVVVLDDIGADGDVKYWRDENGVHHVPKRKLEDLIIE